MVFNPYQSNLLRFVVGQYRRGVDRHRSAFGQAHSGVRLSAELGAALFVLPVYAIARTSVLAGRKLRQAVSQQRFNLLTPQARKLLNLSGSEPTQPIFQTLVAVGACLSPAQIRALSEPSSVIPDGSEQSKFRLVRWVDKWRTAARQLLRFDRKILSVGLEAELCFGGGDLSSLAQITGVASDLKTRSLLLVLDHRAVWNGLSADQQLRLQHQIVAFLNRGFIGLASRPREPKISSLANSSSIPPEGEPGLKCLAIQKSEATSLSASGDFKTAVELARLVSTSTLSTQFMGDEKSDHKPVQGVIEADVVSVTYVEHPLEKMLKWVDRILLWIEKKWRWFNHWIGAVLHK